jgi:glycerol-3-phosphate acyltransferase PlsX
VSVRVAVDALGGDYGPRVAVEGAVRACRENDIHVVLVGPRDLISTELARTGGDGRITVVDAPDSVAMAEKVTRATLKKRSSIQVAIEQVRDGTADAFFSAGNTAACWAIAKLVLGTLEGVDRAALAAVMPNLSGHTVLLDVGANANCRARHLEEFAVMGSVYAELGLKIPNPRVGLLSVGEEETKGNELVKEVHEVLRASKLNFVGNVEGRDIFLGTVDVVVTDGFTGNVVLKASETLATSMMKLLKQELMRSWRTKIGALLSKPAFLAIKKRVDPDEHGGVPLLGINGACLIGHGKSDAYAINNGIQAAARFFTSGVNEGIVAALKMLTRGGGHHPATGTGTV